MSQHNEKETMWTRFESSKSKLGWRLEVPDEPRADLRMMTKGGKRQIVWRKYSKYYQQQERYFFGLDIDWLAGLTDDDGGVLFMMPGVDYALVPFAELSKLLDPATRVKNGKEVRFLFKSDTDSLRLLPGGTNTWQDVTQFRILLA